VEAALPVLAAAGVPLLAHAELLEDVPPMQVRVGCRDTKL
jgi:hypothetical protein